MLGCLLNERCLRPESCLRSPMLCLRSPESSCLRNPEWPSPELSCGKTVEEDAFSPDAPRTSLPTLCLGGSRPAAVEWRSWPRPCPSPPRPQFSEQDGARGVGTLVKGRRLGRLTGRGLG